MLKFLTSGESHGRGLISIIEGFPAGVPVDTAVIDADLRRRMGGYGRGARMRIESDRVEIYSGVRHGLTLGSPISFLILNRDWENWSEIMCVDANPAGADKRRVTRPRPGHADLAGALKYHFSDLRNVLERSSARETASRVAVGGFCRLLLRELGIQVYSHTVSVKNIRLSEDKLAAIGPQCVPEIESSPVRCADRSLDRAMQDVVDEAMKSGDTVGGVFEVRAAGVPPGLGSYTHWDRRLDGRLAQAVMSIPAVKCVQIGSLDADQRSGSEYHDPIWYDDQRQEFRRRTNHAGGVEGGVSNGEEIVVRGRLKPIPTLRRPLMSVDIVTKAPCTAQYERSDTCVVPAAGVVGEAVVCIVLAQALQEKCGGDSLAELRSGLDRCRQSMSEL